MSTSIINIAVDILPSPTIELVTAAWRDKQILETRMELDPNTMLVMCSDGALLAIRYMPSRELVSSLRQGRLMDTITRLKARSQWAYLVLCGNISSTYAGKMAVDEIATDWEWAAIQGALASIQEAGVTVWQIGREPHLPGAVETIVRRDRKPNRVRPVREALFVSETEDMLLALPSIGETRLDALLRHTAGSGAYALVALTDPASKIPGIGPAVKADVRKALGLQPDMTLAVICKDPQEQADGPDTTEHPDTTSTQQLAAAAA